MNTQIIQAAGYLVVFAPYALFLLGQYAGVPYVAFVAVFGVGPFLRIGLGNLPEEAPEWDERLSVWLERLPMIYGLAMPALFLASLRALDFSPTVSVFHLLLSGLSLWTCNFFAVVVAHELIHRPGLRRRVGGIVAGLAGYPWLGHEHLMHHSTSGNVELAEWPRLDESVWAFAARRTRRVVCSSLEHNAAAAMRSRLSVHRGGLLAACTATVVAATAFSLVGGLRGLVFYFCVCGAVHFGVQAVTYLQHWGLGTDSVTDAQEGRYAWEDRCRFQGWLMLHLALHQSHHQRSSVPYYLISVDPRSPRLPAGYVVLLLASFVPPLWRWLMEPALENWKVDPAAHVEPARWRLICLPTDYGQSREV